MGKTTEAVTALNADTDTEAEAKLLLYYFCCEDDEVM